MHAYILAYVRTYTCMYVCIIQEQLYDSHILLTVCT